MAKLTRLRWFRERRSLAQEELAKAIGASRGTITRLENGEDAYPQTVRKIAEALGVNPEDLMEPTLKTQVEHVLVTTAGLKPATPGSRGFDGFLIEEAKPDYVVIRHGPSIMAGFTNGSEGLDWTVPSGLRAARTALTAAGFDAIAMKDNRGFFLGVTAPKPATVAADGSEAP